MRRTSLFALGSLCVVSLGLPACDTMSSDFASFFETFNPPTPAQAAEWAVDTNDPENQRRGVALLASAPWGGAAPYVKLYRLYVEENTDPLVKSFALRALGRHGDAADAVLVSQQLSSPFKNVRLEAAKALQRLHDPSVADVMWQRLVDENEEEEVRVELAIGLGQYPTDAVFQALVLGVDQRELAINLACLDSLQTLTGKDFAFDKAKWLAWRESTTSPFLNDERYLYPTFIRSKMFMDYLLFWVPLTFEEPGVPVGTKLSGPRRTYEGEEQPPTDFKLPESEAERKAADEAAAAASKPAPPPKPAAPSTPTSSSAPKPTTPPSTPPTPAAKP